ncbi:CRISPR-associated protein Cas4 [Bremerella cremea]|uniref:CRISPR-associated exonuclease Cas4 n=1 Tax=Blastopirellula marina TaxID=124 RepID=A0A2S8FDH8_9BACT|nr:MULTISPECIES: CRISPR-associated protein Cas4 [Pirellulaceae]PQO30217.1 CRISPR-associated protein Cas4 [Blastopirellula marina]RCS43568.1 CRISPR-associated protein Cas4 [Bremerella cremea]
MPYTEAELIPLSALQHLLFCPRQAALIHVEQLWAENRLTVEGMHLHRRAHEATDELRGDTRIVRGLALRSLAHGLVGMADIVEFTPNDETRATTLRTTPLRGLFQAVKAEPAAWQVTPVEYKRGKPKSDESDRVQLCAQTLCLEEMLMVKIAEGSLFYGKRKRRTRVLFDAELRATTVAAAERFHQLFSSGVTPPAVYSAKCDNCSLISLCLPKIAGRGLAQQFLNRQFSLALSMEAPRSDPDDHEESA